MTNTNTKTLAQLKLLEEGEPELREAHYRRLRATTVLAASSKYIANLQDRKLNKALAQMRVQNFDMERVSPTLVEYIFASFDEKTTNKITAEFMFVPEWTNIQNHGGCVAFCDLCGKGDSLEHRENRDKLRYTYKLQNTAGGSDIWVGSSCILHHGLHVDGARTAEEAERLLKKAFNVAKKQWEIEAWRAANPDHFEIAPLWERFRSVRFYTYHEEFYAQVGIERAKMLNAWYGLMGKNRDGKRDHFAGAYKQYVKRGALTEGKHDAWIEAQRMMGILDVLAPIFQKAKQIGGWQSYKVEAVSLDYIDKEMKAVKARKSWKALIAPTESIKARKAAEKAGPPPKKRSPRRTRR